MWCRAANLLFLWGVWGQQVQGQGVEEEGYLLEGTLENLALEGSGASFEGSAEGSGEEEAISYRHLRNITTFPACISDTDCQPDFKCFQYMCFPWSSHRIHSPFRSCKRRSDCQLLGEEEGGDGGDGDCYRHQDRRNVFSGICLARSELQGCFDHSDCEPHLRCTNLFCGEPHYYRQEAAFIVGLFDGQPEYELSWFPQGSEGDAVSAA